MNLNSHFFIGIPGPTLDRSTQRLLREVRPGGIILFGRNVRSARQLAQLTRSLRRLLGANLLICLDHEGGRVNRLKDLVGVVPSAMQLGHLKREDWAREHGRLTGRLLREVGVNLNLAPVLDLWLRPKTDNSVPDRCWSRNPKQVIQLAGAFLEGMQRQGVIGCGKHFLGYGAADKDPHLLLPRVNRTRNEILKQDLAPYAGLVSSSRRSRGRFHPSSLHMIMLSHAHLRAFHGNRLTPACISPVVAESLLRGALGFQGVSITDDLEMGAITRTMSIGEATVKCLERGIDLILICHTARAIREGFVAAQRAVRQGRLDAEALTASEQRIRDVQQAARISHRFSQKNFDAITRDIHRFTHKVFRALPPSLRVIDERWGAIGEKY